MAIELLGLIPIKDINPNKINPRVIRDKKFQELKQSLLDFPDMLSLREIVVDDDNIILGGNMRYNALKDLNIKEAYVIKWYGLTEEQKKEFIIKDNANYGNWDWDVLANLFNEEDLKRYGLNVWQPQEIYESYDDNEFDYNDDEQDAAENNIETYKKKEIIVVEFNILDYPVAFDLIKTLTEKGADIGALLIEKLKEEYANI
jgi:predicted PolB exonuclease-like 3'-5' exonuclease